MREVVFYRTESGDCPVEAFLDTLSAKQAQKVTWVMKLIEDLEVVPVKYFKKMTGTDDIWEIRIQSGNNIFRILSFVEANNLVILNHAFQKKSQKTPKKEIAIAEVGEPLIKSWSTILGAKLSISALRNLAIALLLLAFRALILIIFHPNMMRPDLIRGSLEKRIIS